jgi:Peptidase family M28
MAEFRILGRDSVSQAGARHLARSAAIAALVLGLLPAADVEPPLVPDSLLRTILRELSVDNALKQTAAITSHARYPNSQGFFDAAEYVAARAREYGLQNVRVERFAQNLPMWDAEEAEVALMAPTSERIQAVLAQHSADGDFTAQLVDASEAASGGQLRGKVLLSDEEPDAAWRRFGGQGPAAVISDAAGEYFGRRTPPDAILWSMVGRNVTGLMISPRDGEHLRTLLQRGPVTLHVRARARRTTPGAIGMVMGEIPGAVNGQDIVIAAHLDHQFPGANDNGSGDGTLLELVRTLNRLIETGRIPRPHRTIRFWWTTEIASEQAYFRKHPEDARNILLSVVLDQAGGERNTENNFIAIANPDWLQSYADDLIENLAEYVKNRYAPAEHQPDPLLVATGGSHQSLRTVYWEYQPITDEVAFEDKDIRIPGIALAVPSLDLIHTNLDTVDRLDPTWMKRSALLTLASALYVANAGPAEARAVLEYTFRRSASRLGLSRDPAHDLLLERARLDSVRALDPQIRSSSQRFRLDAIAKTLESSGH